SDAMAANPPGVPGALFDPYATNGLGGLCCGIGCGTNSVYGPPLLSGLGIVSGSTVGVAHIGFSAPYTAAQACGNAGDAVVLDVATSDVAPGGTLPAGGINRTGKTILAGSAAFGTKTPQEPEIADFLTRSSAAGGSVSAATASALD